MGSETFAPVREDLSPTEQVYRMPPRAIADLVDAPVTPAVSVCPNREWLLVMERAGPPPISKLAAPELRLAGLRIDPRTNGRSRAS